MRIRRIHNGSRAWIAALLCFCLLFGCWFSMPVVKAEASKNGTIIATSLYVRTGPGTSYSKVKLDGEDVLLTKNTIVEILSEKDGWYQIHATRSGQQIDGYVSGKYVQVAGEQPKTPTKAPTVVPPKAPTKAPTIGEEQAITPVSAKVSASAVNMRNKPGTSGTQVMDTLTRGQALTVIGKVMVGSEQWYKVTYSVNAVTKTAYAYGSYVTFDTKVVTLTPTPQKASATPTPTTKASATPTPTTKASATPTPTTKASATPTPGLASQFAVSAKVSATELNVRSAAGTDSNIITMLKRGDAVTATGVFYKNNEKWYRISFDFEGTKTVGYVYGAYLSLLAAIPTATPPLTPASPTPPQEGIPTPPPEASPTPSVGPTATPPQEGVPTDGYAYPARISAYQLNFRKGVGAANDILAVLRTNDKVLVTGEEYNKTDKWYRLNFDGLTGYAFSDYVILDYEQPVPAVAAELLRLRMKPSQSAAYAKNLTGSVASVPEGAAITLIGEQMASEEKWFHLTYSNGTETVEGYAKGNSIRLGAAEATPTPPQEELPTPTPTPPQEESPTPTPPKEESPTPTPKEELPTPTPQEEVPTPTPQEELPTATPTPPQEELPTATPTPPQEESPTPTPKTVVPDGTLPAADAKENTPGEQVGWGHASVLNASSVVMKQLPKSGVGSVKVEGSSTSAVIVTPEAYLKLYGLYVDNSGNVYRHVGTTYRQQEYYGYILADRVTECEAPATPTPTPPIYTWLTPTPTPVPGQTNPSGDGETPGHGVTTDFEVLLAAQNFPEDYKPALRELHAKYPNWVFQAFHTGLDWSTAIAEENIPGKNLIPNSYGIGWKSLEEGAYSWNTDSFIVYDGSTWVTASKEALEYYMDPRNFLDEKMIFQFEVLRYEPKYQNLEGIENLLRYSPMYQTYYLYKADDGTPKLTTYSKTFLDAAIYSGVSPYHLVTRVKQEVVTGTTSMSNSVSGTVSGYEGLYNFYNIGAYHSTKPGGAIANGLKFSRYGSSSNEALNVKMMIPWTDRYRSIMGGAVYIGDSYISHGQDTIYLQKFNMTATNTYGHQYMANVVAPSSEGKRTAQAYSDAGSSPIVFSIPVFQNMPSKVSPQPAEKLNPNNYLSKLQVQSVDGTNYQLTPSFNAMNTTLYSLIVDRDTEVISIDAKAVSKKATVKGGGYLNLEVGMNEFLVTVFAEDMSSRVYKICIVRE